MLSSPAIPEERASVDKVPVLLFRSAALSSAPRRRDLVAGERDGEPGAGADAAVDGDLAADRLDQVLDDREAQAGPAELAAARLVDAVEPLEDAGQVVAGDADAVVGDL